jgi:hypothetical protein
MHKEINLTILLIILLTTSLTACLNQSDTLGAQQALDIVWEDLEPHTSSKDRQKWEIGDARQVDGRDVVEEFANTTSAYCPGPPIPDNQPIQLSGEYWYILVLPHPATPMPQEGETSPTAPPAIPEPFVREAAYLIDIFEGKIVARRLNCIAY